MSTFEISVRFFLQLAVLLAVCRVVGALARRLGQPQVVGEMIAGVLLGPSVFGAFCPEILAWIFPREARPVLFSASQLGLALYMFLVGLSFRREHFRKEVSGAAAVSLAGMAVPFALGALLSLALHGRSGFFAPKASGMEAALFLGASMCITAFPMLARILVERGLAGSKLGTLALAAGAMDDVAAWCLLAVVLSTFSDDASTAVLALGGGAAYAVVVLFLGTPLFRRLGESAQRAGELTQGLFGITLMLVMLGSWFTDAVGIYAVFGAFLMGIAMPRGFFAEELRKQLEPLVVVLLLPLFFTWSGLNTRLDLLVSPELWLIALAVLVVAIAGKGLACFAAARWRGISLRESVAIGALMNARGLMELILLNIGLERGLIGPELFSVLVLMAVITTLMATPIFERALGKGYARSS